MTADALAALSEGERRVLALLAAGHTAKSIAAELDMSVNAVNERLRDARRKTGAGSSRELARALAAGRAPQESRDDFVGMAMAPAGGESGPVGATHGAWLRIGVPLMILAALLAIAVLPARQASVPVDDTLIGPLVNREEPGVAELHARVRAQRRDPAAEALLLSRYRALPDMSGATMRVVCGDTMCEVAGAAPRGRSLVALQKLGLSGLISDGFRGTFFQVGALGKGRDVFVTYLDRGPARRPAG